MKILITGADGFIGRNLRLRLRERTDVEVTSLTREDSVASLQRRLTGVEFVFHLAGVNRPKEASEFGEGNAKLTQTLVHALVASDVRPAVAFASSIQAGLENPYGVSKRQAEHCLFQAGKVHGFATHIFRLPNVFGKWSRPNYNSAVATFCHNIARGLPIRINDPAAPLTLVYVDDVVDTLIGLMDGVIPARDGSGHSLVQPQYTTTVGDVATAIHAFKASRDTLVTERVGTGLTRALYSTYLSFLPPESFAYTVPRHGDHRGVFVEMLKTPDAGQFSFFTAHPGVTRGGHYHHTKTEKFLVMRGKALFKFRHMHTGEQHELVTSGEHSQIVETVPGWTHDITNVGEDELIVMLWANEIFDRARPDTYASPL